MCSSVVAQLEVRKRKLAAGPLSYGHGYSLSRTISAITAAFDRSAS